LLIQELHEGGDELCVCDVVIAEVFAGLRPEHREAAERLLSAWTFLPTSATTARQAGQWRYDFARRGTPLATTDTLVAAITVAHGGTLITGNVKDYPMSEISLLPLERPRRPRGGGV
jgi:tRNA(fMet)-specific endonuclease VapC